MFGRSPGFEGQRSLVLAFSQRLPSHWWKLPSMWITGLLVALDSLHCMLCVSFTALWLFTAGSKIYCEPRYGVVFFMTSRAIHNGKKKKFPMNLEEIIIKKTC